ncbi:MAG: 8-oxo-dGTP diphosphatase [Clostridia bacterium]|nr:8-oxo-dGTP diphosphatase [Clostridia bacterium]
MRLTTLCYIERDGQWLMLNRVKKRVDENAGKWIGVGGKLEENECPEECIAREVREETGMILKNARLRGVITFILPDWGNEMTFLYTGEAEGEPSADCPEGILRWVPIGQVEKLALWEGDRIFLPLLQTRQGCFSLKLVYAAGGSLAGCLLDGKDITKALLGEHQ